MDPDGRVAAIDCGTNSTRLLVAGADGRPVERLMRITRLGQGVDSTGALAPEAVERCLAALREFRGVTDRYQVARGRLAATSAARDASNGDEFLEAAGEIAGFRPELLAGTQEGRLSLAGAVSDLEPVGGPFLVLDIGGGSTELVTGTDANDPELVAVSLQMGCVRVTERFLLHDPPTPAELVQAEAMVGGSCSRNRPVTRTQPICRDTATSSGSLASVPVTSSVEPPPMSSTRNGPPSGSRSETAPASDSRPSCVPASSSGWNPAISPAASRDSSPFEASRAADVAANLPRATWYRSVTPRNSRSAARQLSLIHIS